MLTQKTSATTSKLKLHFAMIVLNWKVLNNVIGPGA